jgi:hypothetical protein
LRPFKALRAVFQDAERRRRRQVLQDRPRRLWRFRHLREAKPIGHFFCEFPIDIGQVRDHADADCRVLAFAEFEDESVLDVGLFRAGLAPIKLPRLAVMVSEFLAPHALFRPGSGKLVIPRSGRSRGPSRQEFGS